MITGSIARSANLPVFSLLREADFEVFRPAGVTRCTDGVKFAMEEGTSGCRTPKIEIFTQIRPKSGI